MMACLIPNVASMHGDGLYQIETSQGPRRYPRVTAVLSEMENPFLSKWLINRDRESYKASVLGQLLSTMLGDTDTISRADALALVGTVSPASESGAAEYGTRLHAAIERFLRCGDRMVETDIAAGFGLWARWYESSGLRAVAIEERVACVSCGYGGTADCIAADPQGGLWLLEWKTGKAISPVSACQAAAYSHAYPEPIAGAIVLRVGHTARSRVTAHRFSALDLGGHLDAFLHALQLWKWQRRVAGRDAGDEPLGHALSVPVVLSSAA